MAVGAELTNTPTIITHTGIFDNIDKLYGNKISGATAGGAEAPSSPPPPGGGFGGGDFGGGADLGGGEPELGGAPEIGGGAPPAEAEVTPESINRDNLKILVERSTMTEDESYIDLSKGKNSLGEIESQLSKLLKD